MRVHSENTCVITKSAWAQRMSCVMRHLRQSVLACVHTWAGCSTSASVFVATAAPHIHVLHVYTKHSFDTVRLLPVTGVGIQVGPDRRVDIVWSLPGLAMMQDVLRRILLRNPRGRKQVMDVWTVRMCGGGSSLQGLR